MFKTIVAFSDTHNTPLPDKLLSIIEENDYVFFLGDGIKSLGELAFHSGFYGVTGNCDGSIPQHQEQVVEIDGLRMLLTHGDKYHVKNDLIDLAMRAKELDCTIVFYGHTHFAEIDRYENITFVCPGSIYNPLDGTPTYAYATVFNGKFVAKIVNLS